jgi:uridine phosphorylase
MEAVRATRGVDTAPLPPVCVLDFDGDLWDGLAADGAPPVSSWACFHTRMLGVTVDGTACGVVPRTIGGPYAVLVAEQLHAAGVRVIVGLTSAGRVSPTLPLPCLVVADQAVRDEGTSLHYLPPSRVVATPTPGLAASLATVLGGVAGVQRGLVWTTDAPYRETAAQLREWAEAGALAVEMQAAALFAFGQRRGAHVGVVAVVSNSVGTDAEQFDTGDHDDRVALLHAIVRGAAAFLAAPAERA